MVSTSSFKRISSSKLAYWSVCFLIVFALLTILGLSANLEAHYGRYNKFKKSLARGTLTDDTESYTERVNEDTRLYMEKNKPKPATYSSKINSASAAQSPNICPEIDIPGNDRNLKIVLDEIDLAQVEAAIFKEAVLHARNLTQEVSHSVRAIYQDHEPKRHLLQYYLADELKVGNYWYRPGGRWTPADCIPRWKVAIVIPFRDRLVHLSIFLRHLVPFLMSQYLEFGIFVIEQANDLSFNRAMLMNVGYLESFNFSQWDCLIFHDVDHIPLSYSNYYGCGSMPRHFISGEDVWDYEIKYEQLFGGVTGFTENQIVSFNGFPNAYWGWGGEDDDIYKRTTSVGLARTRPAGQMGYYNVIPHHHESAPLNKNRFCLLDNYEERLHTDGLNNIKYERPSVSLSLLYTNISVDIRRLPWNRERWRHCEENK